MINILMVCLGNICRSPLAEAVLRHKLPANKFLIDSAGTAGYHIGNSPDSRAIDVAQRYGLDISQQQSRQFSPSDFDKFHYIFAMDDSNHNDLIAVARKPSDTAKITRLLDYAEVAHDRNVPDPYYGSIQDFETVYQMLDAACHSIAEKIISNH